MKFKRKYEEIWKSPVEKQRFIIKEIKEIEKQKIKTEYDIQRIKLLKEQI